LLFFVILVHVVVFIPQFNTRHEHEAITFIILAFISTTVTFTIPTILTYLHAQKIRRKYSSDTSANSVASYTLSEGGHLHVRLSLYLQNSDNFQAFHEFLAKEFALENLLFWRDVTNVRNFIKNNVADLEASLPGYVHTVNLSEDGSILPSTNALQQMLQMLLKTYIEDDAPAAINISWQMRTEMCEELRNLKSQSMSSEEFDGIFKRAIKEVLEMLECDHFLRFIKSEFYVNNQPANDAENPLDTKANEKLLTLSFSGSMESVTMQGSPSKTPREKEDEWTVQ